ncbi:recombinase family protein [Clostridium pasteurianum]|uniref:Site-specific recombinase, DNA invertase Pin n=1 Tax=Clostridium pasteurianum BC1 TaxID=86416 RepID=R4K449_CLOPA|nr:recombinase family protein [Clostridium pasteurianum]AGK97358.1 site-specific recombinase, DNA invertase Pin [Clostridium pasteurianum BC1]
MKVAVYGRVSTEDQKERSTIENQVTFAKKYCDLHELDIFKIYKEEGISGTIPLNERDEGKKLIEAAKNKEFDTLLVYKLDRLGRSARITLNSIYELESYGLKIKSMTEPFDTSNPSGRFMITMLAGVADLERETILERMWHGANRAARDGKWLGGIVPYGYFVNDDKYLEINNNIIEDINMSEADVIRLIFELVANKGYSTIKVCDYLNLLKAPTSYIKDSRVKLSKGKRKEATAGIWRPNAVRRIIINKTYMGIHEYGKRSKKENREIITRHVQAIVDNEVWEKAQETLKSNQIESMRNSTREYLLRSLIKCSNCGCTFTGVNYRKRKDRKDGAYYVCCGKQNYKGPFNGKCSAKNLPAAWVENYVWDDVVNFIKHPGEAINQLEDNLEIKKSEKANIIKQREQLLYNIENKDNEKQSILDLYRSKLINNKDLEIQLNKIAEEINQSEILIKEIDKDLQSQNSIEAKFDSVEELLSSLRLIINKEDITFEDKRYVILSLVDEVKVTTLEDDLKHKYAKIDISYKFDAKKRGNVKSIKRTLALVAIMLQIKSVRVQHMREKDILVSFQIPFLIA